MMEGDTLEEKLDSLIFLLSLEKEDELEAVINAVDDTDLAFIKHADGWTSSSDLKEAVKDETGIAERTARRRISDLKSTGLLESRGKGPAREYRRRPVFEHVPQLADTVNDR